MTDAKTAQIDIVLAALRERQARNEAPLPGEVTPTYLAKLAREIGQPVSATTFREVEKRALAKLRLSNLALEALHYLRTAS
jgi:hypothetical protein